MRLVHALFLPLFLLCIIACRKESEEKYIIDRAETCSATRPDSALILLDSIALPEEMSLPLLGRWCMLYARSADKIEEEMPYVHQLLLALDFYKKKRQTQEIAEMTYYLGRSYMEDKEYDKAIQAYIDALQVALEIEDYNLAGYITSYMGDLYEINGTYLKAADRYEESGTYFRQAGNVKSHVFALVNAARDYGIDGSYKKALACLQKADTIAGILNDPKVFSYVYNLLASVYNELGEYDLATSYQLKDLKLDTSDLAPCYLNLVDIYINKKEWENAVYYLEKARISSKNEYISAGRHYRSYLIDKEKGRFEEALSHLEQYRQVADSLDEVRVSLNLAETENKYKHLKIYNENIQLRINKQRSYILLFVLFSVCALLLIVYLWTLKQKNQRIWKQQQAIHRQNENIYSLSTELQRKKEELQRQSLRVEEAKQLLRVQSSLEEEQMKYEKIKMSVESLNLHLLKSREEKLQQSAVAKKLEKLSRTVRPNTSQSLIPERYWRMIEELIKEVYPSAVDHVENIGLTPAERRVCYLSLFKFDIPAIAILLNIAPDSVHKQRLRIRQKLNLVGKNQSFYDYLVSL